MFVTRLISGIVLVAVALLTICSGGWILYGNTDHRIADRYV